MSDFLYTPLAERHGLIRLLRLLPSEDPRAQISCELFDYDLMKAGKSTPQYEALSYVWGSSDDPRSISVAGATLKVTQNLYAALLDLRDHGVIRTLWIDAICINQQDNEEKGFQIRSMACVYAMAKQVLVWLGPAADGSDELIDAMRQAGKSKEILTSPAMLQSGQKLAERLWFRRIWILQEVAAARYVLIKCGFSEIDGQTFGVGLGIIRSLPKSPIAQHGPLQGILQLLQEATSRSRYKLNDRDDTGMFSLDIAPLGRLVDLYQHQDATHRHDKLYALLGMATDDVATAGLLPDYRLSWSIVYKNLIQYFLSDKAKVRSWDESEIAIIQTRGCAIAEVDDVEDDEHSGKVLSIRYARQFSSRSQTTANWVLPLPPKAIHKGDIICQLVGTSAPTIIRPDKEYFVIIAMAIEISSHTGVNIKDMSLWTNGENTITDGKARKVREITQRDFLLVWDWETNPKQSLFDTSKRYRKLIRNIELNSSTSSNGTDKDREDDNQSATQRDHCLRSQARLNKFVLTLLDLHRSEEAIQHIGSSLSEHENMFHSTPSVTLQLMGSMELAYLQTGRREEAEKVAWKILLTHISQLDPTHDHISISLHHIMYTYFELFVRPSRHNADHFRYESRKVDDSINLDRYADLLRPNADLSLINEGVFYYLASKVQGHLMKFLLVRIGHTFKITVDVIKAACSTWPKDADNFQSVMTWLLRDDLGITTFDEDAVSLIMQRATWSTMESLLRLPRDAAPITPGAFVNTIRNGLLPAVRALLCHSDFEFDVSPEAIVAAASRIKDAPEIMELLLTEVEQETITPEVLKAAAGNKKWGKMFVDALLPLASFDTITPEVLRAGVENAQYGIEITQTLLSKALENNLTQDVLMTAARHPTSSEELLALLLSRKQNRFDLADERVMETALLNNMKEVSRLQRLLNSKGPLPISQKAVENILKGPLQPSEILNLFANECPGEIEISRDVVDTVLRQPDLLQPGRLANHWDDLLKSEALELMLRRKQDFKIRNEILELIEEKYKLQMTRGKLMRRQESRRTKENRILDDERAFASSLTQFVFDGSQSLKLSALRLSWALQDKTEHVLKGDGKK